MTRLDPFHIGPVKIDPPTILAPMAGITDAYFRKIVKQIGGVGLVTMEFISSESLIRGVEKTKEMMEFCDAERPISIQIYGSRPEPMAETARYVEAIGADIVDINMGCPANKILKGCAGCALMGDLDHAKRIIRSVRSAVSIPLTVKFRAGLSHDRLNDVELGRICEGEGVDAIALHPRTAKQLYRGRSDWSRIARLKDAVSIPVVGNGDVVRPSDAFQMLSETACDGVMIGRASMKNPWIYRQIEEISEGRAPTRPTWWQRRDLILNHFAMLDPHPDRKFVLHKLRKFTGWYSKGLPGGCALRQQLTHLKTAEEFMSSIREFFEKLEDRERQAA